MILLWVKLTNFFKSSFFSFGSHHSRKEFPLQKSPASEKKLENTNFHKTALVVAETAGFGLIEGLSFLAGEINPAQVGYALGLPVGAGLAEAGLEVVSTKVKQGVTDLVNRRVFNKPKGSTWWGNDLTTASGRSKSYQTTTTTTTSAAETTPKKPKRSDKGISPYKKRSRSRDPVPHAVPGPAYPDLGFNNNLNNGGKRQTWKNTYGRKKKRWF